MFSVVMGMTGGEAPDESAPIQDGYLPLRSGSLSTRKKCRGCSRFLPKLRDLLRKSVATMKHYLLREGINESVLFGTDGKEAGTICLRDEQKFE